MTEELAAYFGAEDHADPEPTEPEDVQGLWSQVYERCVYRSQRRATWLTSLRLQPKGPLEGGPKEPSPAQTQEQQGRPQQQEEQQGQRPQQQQQQQEPEANHAESVASSQRELVGVEDDILQPSPAQIERVFRRGRASWHRLVGEAKELPGDRTRKLLSDPTIMLGSVPALPNVAISTEFLKGYAMWRVSSDENTNNSSNNNSSNNDGGEAWLDERPGPTKYIRISQSKAIKCEMVQPEHQPPGYKAPIGASQWLPVFTLAWAYVLSARLLELQGRRIRYKYEAALVRQRADTAPGKVTVDVGLTTSPRLTRWLRALLGAGEGYGVYDGDGLPPWVAYCDGNVHFHMNMSGEKYERESIDPGPDSDDAGRLIIQLCRLLKLYGDSTQERFDSGISPCLAGFLAALALPYYHSAGLTPTFQLTGDLILPTQYRFEYCDKWMDELNAVWTGDTQLVRDIMADLPYYMTLSLDTAGVASSLWSVFWHPQVRCNVVSAWTGAILGELRPHLDAGDVHVLAWAFGLRRPQIAPWWLGVFLLGDNKTMLGRIRKYLVSLEEDDGFESTMQPQLAAAAWTGVRQSFLDEERVEVKVQHRGHGEGDGDGDGDVGMSRADMLYVRQSYRLSAMAYPVVTWRPFGFVSSRVMDPELRRWMGFTHTRKYKHWVWVRQGTGEDVQMGYRADKAQAHRQDDDVREMNGLAPDGNGTMTTDSDFGKDDEDDVAKGEDKSDVEDKDKDKDKGEGEGKDEAEVKGEAEAEERDRGDGQDKPVSWIGLAPSKRATWRMLEWCMADTTGDLHPEKADIADLDEHPWKPRKKSLTS